MEVKEQINSIILNEYDKYDIIDFLEWEYINDWLNLIPNQIWIKNKNIIENRIYKLSEPKIISYIINKINLNLAKYIVSNFSKINLDLLKFCIDTNFDKFKIEIKNSCSYKKIIFNCIYERDYEFNKYFYETIYFELEHEHKFKPATKNVLNMFGFLLYDNENIHPNNMFYNLLIKNINNQSHSVPNFDVFKYYYRKFTNALNMAIKYSNKQYLKHFFMNIFYKSKINNFEDLIELKNILNITHVEFKKYILIENDNYSLIDISNKSLILNICKTQSINFIIKILNLLDNEIIQQKDNIIHIMVSMSLTNKIKSVYLIYNWLVYDKKCIFTKEIYSLIIKRIIIVGEKNFHEYNEIIFELINLGGEIKGFSIYTDYIEKIKIKK